MILVTIECSHTEIKKIKYETRNETNRKHHEEVPIKVEVFVRPCLHSAHTVCQSAT